jgi:PEP-CTERM/exosortase A-associated glycosyltransferase
MPDLKKPMTTHHWSLKILHILNHSLPLQSGYAFRSHNILRAQLNMGWQPIALTAPVAETSWIDRGADELIGGLRYYRTAPLSGGDFPLSAAFRSILALNRRAREVSESEKPNLLHAHSPIFNAFSSFHIGRKLGLPVVYEVHSLWEDAAVIHGAYPRSSWRYKLMQSLETWVCRKADHVAVLCHGLKGDLTRRGIPLAKLTVVPNGVDVDEFNAGAPDLGQADSWNLHGRHVIGFIGSFSRYEGLDLLLEAMARLTSRRPDVVLLLVGGGRMEERLKAHVERLRLVDRVIMPGRIPHDRIPGVYALMDILVYPRYSTRLTELVTPLKPLEAMAMGKAVVASDIGGHRELIQDRQTGLLFPPGDAAALADALTGLLDDHDLRRQLGRQASLAVRQKHSWAKATAVYSDIYARALGTHDSNP